MVELFWALYNLIYPIFSFQNYENTVCTVGQHSTTLFLQRILIIYYLLANMHISSILIL